MFKLIKIENARMNVPEPEFLEVTAYEAIVEGEALVLSSGKLTKCGTTTKPAFIAMAALAAAATKRVIPVCRVESNQLYEVPIYKSSTTLSIPAVGAAVCLKSDGVALTDATTSGVVTIVDKNGAAAEGDTIIVRIA